MKTVLGLDLGTASIGWAIVKQAENDNERSSIIDMGVRVNPLTVDEKSNFEKGKSITTTADRTLKRGMRRNLQRYRQRRDELVKELTRAGLITPESILSEEGKGTTFETLRLRAKAAHEQISLEQLARVLLSINKKRGYKSNRKANNSDEDGELFDGMEVARRLYDEQITPGEYGYRLLSKGKKYVPQFYPSDLRQELDTVWVTQAESDERLTDELKERIDGKNKKATRDILEKALNAQAAEVKDKKLRRVTFYKWRSRATTQRIETAELITALSEINGDINASSGYLGAISDHSKELFFNKMTVGEFMWDKLSRDRHHSFKNVIFYRTDYLQEFETVWETQAKFYPQTLTPELKHTIRDIIIFYQRRLRSQKGLISFCELESKNIQITTPEGRQKTVTTGARVCPKSAPLYQEFKIWQALNNLELNGERLMMDQCQALYHHLSWVNELSEKEALKVLGLSARGNKLNYVKIPGNKTQATLLKAYKRVLEVSGYDVEDFDKRKLDDQIQFISRAFTDLGAGTDFLTFHAGKDNTEMQQNAMFRLWQLLYSYEDDNSSTGNAKLIDHIEELTGLPREGAAAIANVVFEQDYGSLSSKAIAKILPFMKDEGLIYSEACKAAGYRHSASSITKEENDQRALASQLDLLPKGSLRNPVVEKILNQMIHVVNAAMERYGAFDEIHVEMARELKQTQAQREKAFTNNNEQAREHDKIRETLINKFNIPNPSRNDIIRYRLYQELAPNGYKTLYSGTYIPEEKIFTKEFDIEHIIPQALLFDDSFSNKTLETRGINIDKGNLTAADYIKSKWGETGVDEFRKRISFLNANKATQGKFKRLLVTEKDGKLLYDDGKELEGFLNRDLSDSQYIARKATEILKAATRVVVPTTGKITDRLREDWQLIDMMKELNLAKYEQAGLTVSHTNRDGKVIKRISDWTKRNDHRHHAMDALTVAFTRHAHIQYLNNLSARSADDPTTANIYAIMRKELVDGRRFKAPMPLDEFRAEARQFMERILVSIKAKNKVVTRNINKVKNSGKRQLTLTPRGQLHNETVYGRRLRYETKEERVGATFDRAKIATVARKDYRTALLLRLNDFDGDPKKAFTGKNSLDKNPIYLNKEQTATVPPRVKTVTQVEYFTIRKEITPDLKLDKVVDQGIKKILEQRLAEFGGDPKKAFTNLDENPIYLNREKGITIKRVTITGAGTAIALHTKRDKDANQITDANGKAIPTDYVSPYNNHHVAIFEDENGDWQEHIVSFFEATTAAIQGLSVVDKTYNSHLGWKFLFTMKQNEYFVFPNPETGFDPQEVDLTNPANLPEISENLYRVQKFSSKYYVFRHHLETNVEDIKALQGKTWKRITAIYNLKGIVKVRVNHMGQIVHVGEY